MQLIDRYFNDMEKLEYSSSVYSFICLLIIRCLLSIIYATGPITDVSALGRLVMFNSLQSHGLEAHQEYPWNFLGKITRVGCHLGPYLPIQW